MNIEITFLLGLWFALMKAGGDLAGFVSSRPLAHVQLQACLGCLLFVLLLSKFIVVVKKLVGGKK